MRLIVFGFQAFLFCWYFSGSSKSSILFNFPICSLLDDAAWFDESLMLALSGLQVCSEKAISMNVSVRRCGCRAAIVLADILYKHLIFKYWKLTRCTVGSGHFEKYLWRARFSRGACNCLIGTFVLYAGKLWPSKNWIPKVFAGLFLPSIQCLILCLFSAFTWESKLQVTEM